MKKRFTAATVICLVLVAVMLTFSLTLVFSTGSYNTMIRNLYERQTMYERLEELDRVARYDSLFVTDEAQLTQGLIEGYLAGLGDTKATYQTAAEVAAVNSALLTGLGVDTVSANSGYLYIYNVIEGGSGAAAGLQVGDLIVRLNGREVTTLGYAASAALLAGGEGETVQVDYYRDSAEMSITATCSAYTRANLSYSIGTYQIGYVRITAFDANTPLLFVKAINNLTSGNVTGLILDLRHTSGGSLDAAAQVLDRLLPEGDLMSKTTRDGTVELVYSSDRQELNLPIAVLVDGATSGPAELVAAALADYNRADLVGLKTAGDGTIRESYTLSDGSVVTLSTAIINPPASAPFEGTGLKPDYIVNLPDDSDYGFYSLTADNDSQYKKAYEIVLSQIDVNTIVYDTGDDIAGY